MKYKTKSPIKDKPLRMPGQSLEEERQNLIHDKFLPVFMMAGIAIILAVMEWVRYLNPTRPQPYFFTGVAAIAVAYAAWRFVGLRAHSRNLRQGIEGEKAVGQFLESLRSKGYSVFHDLIGTGFNIDHVLIGPAGVFTIETKTWSKPIRGEARIKFDGEQLTVTGREPDRNPIVQARAQSAWIKTILAESTGHDYDVFPVVVFPGWFVERTEGISRNTWVLEPKALPKFLENAHHRLTNEDVKLASFHLSRFIRSSEQARENNKRT